MMTRCKQPILAIISFGLLVLSSPPPALADDSVYDTPPLTVEAECGSISAKIARLQATPFALRWAILPRRGYLEGRFRHCLERVKQSELAYLEAIPLPSQQPPQ